MTFVTVDGGKATLKGARLAVGMIEDPDDQMSSPLAYPKTFVHMLGAQCKRRRRRNASSHRDGLRRRVERKVL